MDPPAVYISLARWERVRLWGELGAGCVRFPLARWERVRVRDDSIRDVSTSYLGVLRKDAVPYRAFFLIGKSFTEKRHPFRA